MDRRHSLLRGNRGRRSSRRRRSTASKAPRSRPRVHTRHCNDHHYIYKRLRQILETVIDTGPQMRRAPGAARPPRPAAVRRRARARGARCACAAVTCDRVYLCDRIADASREGPACMQKIQAALPHDTHNKNKCAKTRKGNRMHRNDRYHCPIHVARSWAGGGHRAGTDQGP